MTASKSDRFGPNGGFRKGIKLDAFEATWIQVRVGLSKKGPRTDDMGPSAHPMGHCNPRGER